MTAYRIPRDPAAFRLDRDRKGAGGRHHDRNHLDFIRGLSCVICGSHRAVEACHVRFSDASYAKGNPGIGTKPSDAWTVPMCAEHHRLGTDAQHNSNEKAWWEHHRIDPLMVALKLHGISGDDEGGEQIIAAVRKSAVKA